MLQIIGWLLCVYLIVKGCELIAMRHTSAYIGAGFALVAAPIFFFMINQQVKAGQNPLSQLGQGNIGPLTEDPMMQSLDAASTNDVSDAAADQALKEAEEAIRSAEKQLE